MRRVNKKAEIGTGPETSVIIPVYNGESFIKEAVESVLEGIYTDFEIIIVDDAFVSYGAEARKKLIDATLEIPKGKEHKISSACMSIYRKSIIVAESIEEKVV